jgi:hypothetical protein
MEHHSGSDRPLGDYLFAIGLAVALALTVYVFALSY